MNEDSLFKIGIALFAIVNPIGIVPIFISAAEGWSHEHRARIAKTVALTVFLVLALSAFFGAQILDFFGISIPSFQVGGGVLLMLIAISMMHGRQFRQQQRMEEVQQSMDEREVIAVVPLSIPLLAGPGAISSMIIVAQQSKGLLDDLLLVIPIAAVCLLIWLALRLSGRISARLGNIGINVVTRLMGLILAAMSVEFIAQGIIGLFPKLAS